MILTKHVFNTQLNIFFIPNVTLVQSNGISSVYNKAV